MTFAFIKIRDDIQEELNSEILSKIIYVLSDENTFDDNQIRKAIASIEGLNYEKWFYVYHNNIYTNHKFLKNKYICEIIVKLCMELSALLQIGNFEMAYDLIDSYHCLPDIIADNSFTIPKSFWKTHIKSYRDKWDKSFLLTEQKRLGTVNKHNNKAANVISYLNEKFRRKRKRDN